MASQNNSPTGWVGWAYFASFMMMISGLLQFIVGLVAIFNSGYYVVGSDSLIAFNFTTWGWIHLMLGLLVFMAGLELLRGATWARIVAVILTVMSFIANASFFNVHPWWSLIVMVVDVLVIYSLTVHGDELKD